MMPFTKNIALTVCVLRAPVKRISFNSPCTGPGAMPKCLWFYILGVEFLAKK